MDVILIYVFVIFLNVAYTKPITVNQPNSERYPKVRFPIFGSIFGSNEKKSTTTKSLINPSIVGEDVGFTENSNNAFQTGGGWNFFGSLFDEGDKNKKIAITNKPVVRNNTNAYQTDGSVIYTIQNGSGMSGTYGNIYQTESESMPSSSSIIYTVRNKTNNDKDEIITNFDQTEISYATGFNNKDSKLNTNYNTTFNLFEKTKVDTKQSPVSLTVNNQSSKNNLYYHKITNLTGSGYTPVTNNFTYDSGNGNMQSMTNNNLGTDTSNKNVENYKTNVFLNDNKKISTTDINSNNLSDKKNEDTSNNSQQNLLSFSSGYQVVPNALSNTNVEEIPSIISESVLSASDNSNIVIVICRDPITGSVIGKYESFSMLQEYKNVMTEKDGSANWATVGDNSTAISLPTQLILQNISMVIHGRIHYCQILNMPDMSLLQGTNDTKNVETQSMVVDVTYSNTKDTASTLSYIEPSDQHNTKIISPITSGINFLSNLFGANQNDEQPVDNTQPNSKYENTLNNKPPSNNQGSSSLTVEKNTLHIKIPSNNNTENIKISNIASTSSEIYVITESTVNVEISTQIKDNTKDSSEDSKFISELDSKKNTSVLFESHVKPTSENKEKNEDLKKKGEESHTNYKNSKEDKKQDLFISHHGVMTEAHVPINEKDQIKESHKVSSHELYISDYLGHKYSSKDKSNEKVYYSKKPYSIIHEEIPYYSTHIYHHSVEEDSKLADSDEDAYSGFFISKPIKIITHKEDNKYQEPFIKHDVDDSSEDDISSDFEKINAEAKYAVFSFA